jgi:hypothetical protein
VATHGYRVWWSRCGLCPCQNNLQTNQPDIRCTLCHGTGWFYFLPEAELVDAKTDIYGNPVTLNDDQSAVLIQAWMRSLAQDPEWYEKFGAWVFGTASVTVQATNRMAYGDRLIMVDSIMDFSQLLEANGTQAVPVIDRADKSGLRYPAIGVTLLRSLTTIYQQGDDFTFKPTDGSIEWVRHTPAQGTMLTVRYQAHPVYRVMTHINAIRDSMIREKRGEDKAKQFAPLPTSFLAKLDYLLDNQGGT